MFSAGWPLCHVLCWSIAVVRLVVFNLCESLCKATYNFVFEEEITKIKPRIGFGSHTQQYQSSSAGWGLNGAVLGQCRTLL